MIRVFQGQDFVILCVQPGEKHCQVVCLGATVRKINNVQVTGQLRRKSLRILVYFGVHVNARRMPKLLHLLLESLIDFPMLFMCFQTGTFFIKFEMLTDGNVQHWPSRFPQTCPSTSHLYGRTEIAFLPCGLARACDKTEWPKVSNFPFAWPIFFHTMGHYTRRGASAKLLRRLFDLLLHQLCKQDQLKLCKYWFGH